MDSEREDVDFEDVVTILALKVTRIQRNRLLSYYEEVLVYAASVFIHDRRQCSQNAADSRLSYAAWLQVLLQKRR